MVLNALLERPMHGYGIAERISGMTCAYWKPSPGSLYPMLEELINEKMIRLKSVQMKGRKKKVYEITDSGKTELGLSKKNVEAMETRFLEAMQGSKVLSGLSHSQIIDLFRVLKKMVAEDMPEHHATMLEFMFLLKEGRISKSELASFRRSLRAFMDSVAEINKRKLK